MVFNNFIKMYFSIVSEVLKNVVKKSFNIFNLYFLKSTISKNYFSIIWQVFKTLLEIFNEANARI